MGCGASQDQDRAHRLLEVLVPPEHGAEQLRDPTETDEEEVEPPVQRRSDPKATGFYTAAKFSALHFKLNQIDTLSNVITRP